MKELERRAVQQALENMENHMKLIAKIMKLAEAQEIPVEIITPVQYQSNKLIELLFNTKRADFNEGSRSKKIYACFINLGTMFFNQEQSIELAMAKEVYEYLGGVYFSTLDSLYDHLLNKLGEEDA